jgi:hypothetical protein
MLIDSGADVTLVPEAVVDSLSIERSETKYQLLTFDGELSIWEAVRGQLLFRRRIFKGQFLIIDLAIGIAGRVLNHVSLLLDGPNLQPDNSTMSLVYWFGGIQRGTLDSSRKPHSQICRPNRVASSRRPIGVTSNALLSKSWITHLRFRATSRRAAPSAPPR